jgi:glyoxylase-like metal-dependent hydrolase (beta-lactamase superfamily II)
VLKLTLFDTGSCTAWGKVAVRSWSWRKRAFPALAALIEHPKHGYLLFDTGYSSAFFEATSRWPYALYRKLTPVKLDAQQSLCAQLKAQGIAPESIRYLFISHFHADHVAGLRDFPNSQFICSKEAYEDVKGKQGWAALRRAFLPQLMPSDFAQRMRQLSHQDLRPVGIPGTCFEDGVDLFQDGSVIALPLPGHAVGQMGLLLDRKTFLIADAAWNTEALQKNQAPHGLAHLLHPSRAAYLQTFSALYALSRSHPEIELIPSHSTSHRAKGRVE